MKYTIVVNGERHTVDVSERMPLLWVLRDAIGLKGTKFGCGMARRQADSLVHHADRLDRHERGHDHREPAT